MLEPYFLVGAKRSKGDAGAMTAPVWMAVPPKSTRPCSAADLAPARCYGRPLRAWSSLSTEYTTAASELTALMGTVQAGAWEGASADRYTAAHVPYLAWLSETRARAPPGWPRQIETAAASYTAALAAMPTLAEDWPPIVRPWRSWWAPTSSASTPSPSPSTRPTTCACGSRPRPR